MDPTVIISDNLGDLTGEGEEWLVDAVTFKPRMKFYNGDLIGFLPKEGNEEDTLDVV